MCAPAPSAARPALTGVTIIDVLVARRATEPAVAGAAETPGQVGAGAMGATGGGASALILILLAPCTCGEGKAAPEAVGPLQCVPGSGPRGAGVAPMQAVGSGWWGLPPAPRLGLGEWGQFTVMSVMAGAGRVCGGPATPGPHLNSCLPSSWVGWGKAHGDRSRIEAGTGGGNAPWNPGGQVQWKSVPSAVQVPPAWQGWDAQASPGRM